MAREEYGMKELDLDALPDPDKEAKIEYEVEDEGQPAHEPEAKAQQPEAKDEEVQIEEVDDTPPQDRGRKPLKDNPDDIPEDEVAEYSAKVKERISKLRHGYHDERRAKEKAAREREEAIRYAKTIAEENRRLREMYAQGEKAFGQTLKTATQAQLDAARRKVKEAYEAGDSEKLVQAQEELAAAKYRAEQADAYAQQQATVQTENHDVHSQPRTPQPQAPQPDEKARAWQADNSWFGSDDEMTSFALGVHKTLVERGIDPRSDEYYERIDARMRAVFPDKFEAPRNKPAERQRPATVVAPQSRSSAPKKVVLSRSQVAIARRLGVPVEEYARQMSLLERGNG